MSWIKKNLYNKYYHTHVQVHAQDTNMIRYDTWIRQNLKSRILVHFECENKTIQLYRGGACVPVCVLTFAVSDL